MSSLPSSTLAITRPVTSPDYRKISLFVKAGIVVGNPPLFLQFSCHLHFYKLKYWSG
jgi:hypothetical protein